MADVMAGTIPEVKRLRMLKGLTSQMLSELAGVSKPSILSLEGNRRLRNSVLPSTVKLIADALGVEVGDIAVPGPGQTMTARYMTPQEAKTTYSKLCIRCGQWA